MSVKLELFRQMVKSVPAYADFLKRNKIYPKNIGSDVDLKNVPAMSKKNYLRLYPLEKLCLGGALKDKGVVYTATSGSTGKPFYFPRDKLLENQYAVWGERFLENISGNKKPSILLIDCLGMGVWIGGLITYQAFKILAENGRPLSIITPGTNKQEVFQSLRNISHKYEMTILCGYPPFIKDILDESQSEGINLKKLNLKLLFAAEAFSEKFRDYVAAKAGIKNVLIETANIYGSADLGAMAIETPISIFIRRQALKNKKLFQALFGGIDKVPTLAQFNPLFTDFESEDGNILCTGRSVLPLFKYAIGDHGGVIKLKEMVEIFKREGMDLSKLAVRVGIKNSLKLPFVYVYERADFSVKLYGAIIYPEHIKPALLHGSVSEALTGKFTLETVHDEKHNEGLQIHIELRTDKQVDSKLSEKICNLIVDSLLSKNAEYADMAGKRAGHIPKLKFWPYEHPDYFKKGGKQKWVK
ncbi:MAG: hypothetical protein Q7S19_01515 [bacterium]|nr:hypothetical protein [bacterium]